MNAHAKLDIPSHVPANLVLPFPLLTEKSTPSNPYDSIIPQIHTGPRARYVPGGFFGISNAWVFRRVAELTDIYMDTEHFTSKDMAPFASLVGQTWSLVPAESDPPIHAGYRTMAMPLFLPRKLASLDAGTRQFARDYVNRVKERGECEFMSEFAFRFPIAVFLNMMDMPIERIDEFLKWEHMLCHTPNLEVITQGVRHVVDYLQQTIDERRLHPKDDFISYALSAKVDGRDLSADEVMGFCFNLFVGGLDTVSANMGHQFRYLAEHPEQQEQLRADPAITPAAVEELMRAFSAVTTFRTCSKPVKVGDVRIMPGDKIALPTPVANRDPEAFDNPAQVRFDRNPRHVTFASGPHRCIGAPLARRELVIAIEEFLAAIPPFEVKADRPVTTLLGAMLCPDKLWLSW
jgi:cytochrome P450